MGKPPDPSPAPSIAHGKMLAQPTAGQWPWGPLLKAAGLVCLGEGTCLLLSL